MKDHQTSTLSHYEGSAMRDRPTIYMRRCHLCGHTTQKLGQMIERCEHCQKCLPTSYFYEEDEIAVYSDDKLRPPEPSMTVKYRPVRGLYVHWLPES